MGISDLLGLGADIAKPIDAVGNLYTTDKARLEAEKDLQEVTQKPVIAQIGVNAILAASSQLFNSGWQPLIGWTAGFLILIYYAPQIIITTYLWTRFCVESHAVLPFPMKPDDLLNLVYLLFGFGIHSVFAKGIGTK